MKSNWWTFFPLKGLALTDKEGDLANPLWPDSTIISRSHVIPIVRALQLDQHGSSIKNNEEAAVQIVNQAVCKEDYESFIAVLRKGPALRSASKESTQEMREKSMGHPERRARQIAAAIEFAILATRKDWRTCALADQIHRKKLSRSSLRLSLENRSFSLEISSRSSDRTIWEHRDREVISRHGLKNKLDSSPVSSFTSILLNPKRTLASSLHDAITESAIRLSDALHVSNEADQLLGSITAVEILLSTASESFATIQKRIKTLIGHNSNDYFQTENLLMARHKYVHQGHCPNDRALTLKATGLSLSCLLTYSSAAHKFRSKSDFLAYLDFLYLGEAALANAHKSERTVLRSLLKHQHDQHQFNFFSLKKTKRSEVLPDRTA